MLVEARRRLANQQVEMPRVEFVHADALSWTPPAKAYDLIVTNFFLDCFREDQLKQIIYGLAEAAAPQSNWLIADFQTPQRGLQRIRSRLILGMMYAFFKTVTCLPAHQLIEPDPFLQRAGFTLHRRTEAEWGLLRSDWWQR
jgi:ubiquinone/menaquinone biosynthesis C-methylase UbiE